MQSDINRLISWCNKNQLIINVKKTKCVLYGSKHVTRKTRLTPIKMNDMELQYTDHYKYLGITVDCSLNYQKYIKELFKKSAHKIYILSKIRQYLTRDAALQIYKTKVIPYLDYGDILYM